MLSTVLLGARLGPAMESTSAVSRSASPMITWVYSLAPRRAARARAAAPRRAGRPRGFLISCASWRTIRRLPSRRASRSFSRVMRWRCVVSASSSSRCRPVSPSKGSEGHVERARSRGAAAGRTGSSRSAIPSPLMSTRRRMPPSASGACSRSVNGRPRACLQAEGEQVLRGDVGVHRAQLRIQHDDAGGERVEQVGRIEMRER